MGRIDVAFERLQIVALEISLLQKAMLGRSAQELVIRQHRRRALAHIGQQ